MGAHVSDAAAAESRRATAIMNAIRRVVRALRVGAQRAESELGVSAAQIFVLQTLARGPAPSLSAIAARTLTDPSSVSVVVKRLVDRGLVERRTSPTDGRAASIALSRAGRALLLRAPVVPQTRVIEAIERIPPADARALARGLEALVGAMGEEASPASMFFEEVAPSSDKLTRKPPLRIRARR